MAIRTRIGLIVPSTNTTAEADFGLAAGKDVTIHSHRMWMGKDTPEGDCLDLMNQDVEGAAKYLATANMDIIVYACTGGSFFHGSGHADPMIRMIEDIAGVPAVGTADSVLEALKSIGAKRISVASPYPDWLNAQLADYYNKAGFEVLNVEGEAEAFKDGARGICNNSPGSVVEFAQNVCRPESDALFCSCTAWRAMEASAELESHLSKPVVTSNQATVWAAFKKLGLCPNLGFGSLIDSLAGAAV